jgi:hypothetical protein
MSESIQRLVVNVAGRDVRSTVINNEAAFRGYAIAAAYQRDGTLARLQRMLRPRQHTRRSLDAGVKVDLFADPPPGAGWPLPSLVLMWMIFRGEIWDHYEGLVVDRPVPVFAGSLGASVQSVADALRAMEAAGVIRRLSRYQAANDAFEVVMPDRAIEEAIARETADCTGAVPMPRFSSNIEGGLHRCNPVEVVAPVQEGDCTGARRWLHSRNEVVAPVQGGGCTGAMTPEQMLGARPRLDAENAGSPPSARRHGMDGMEYHVHGAEREGLEDEVEAELRSELLAIEFRKNGRVFVIEDRGIPSFLAIPGLTLERLRFTAEAFAKELAERDCRSPIGLFQSRLRRHCSSQLHAASRPTKVKAAPAPRVVPRDIEPSLTPEQRDANLQALAATMKAAMAKARTAETAEVMP